MNTEKLRLKRPFASVVLAVGLVALVFVFGGLYQGTRFALLFSLVGLAFKQTRVGCAIAACVSVLVLFAVHSKVDFVNLEYPYPGSHHGLRLRIGVVVLSTKEADWFASQTIPLMDSYCARHGYDLFIVREKWLGDMHINWTKIAAMLGVLMTEKGKYDFLVTLDADIVILHPQITLESIISRFVDDGVHVGFYEDCWFRHTCGNLAMAFNLFDPLLLFTPTPNVGFGIIRMSNTSVEIYESWLSAASNECRSLANRHPRNQLVWNHCVRPKYKKELSILPANIILQVEQQEVPYNVVLGVHAIRKDLIKGFIELTQFEGATLRDFHQVVQDRDITGQLGEAPKLAVQKMLKT